MRKNKYCKKLVFMAICVSIITFTACNQKTNSGEDAIVEIDLSDAQIDVDGKKVGSNISDAVYVANDIIYYEAGKDFYYGEGTEADAHESEESLDHIVVHITQPGTYRITGKLSKGQIAVDLGEDAKDDPEAVVTLILNGADITCQVAPAVIFYNVYECGNDDVDSASSDIDTQAAGANIIIADDTVNTVNGSYVAKIYDAESVILNDDETEVLDADKLHKYDGAVYSKMSKNVDGEDEDSGVLNINAENEGLDTELHLTINGGNININSGNDGINTNEDNVSVTTINDGTLTISVNGKTGEGDGIDSNGWLVINGGNVIAQACSDSADAGIDSDMGIHINGGTVIASGHMLDRIEDDGQTYAVFSFTQKQTGGKRLSLKNESETALLDICPENGYSVLIYSSPELISGTYTLWSDDTKLSSQGGIVGGSGMEGMEPPEGMEIPEGMEPPEGMEIPEGMEPPEGMEIPEGMEPPEGMEIPEGMAPSEDGVRPEKPEQEMGDFENSDNTQERVYEFYINQGANMFGGIG